MRYSTLMYALTVSGSVLLTGCVEDDAPENPNAATIPTSEVTSDDVAREASEAMNTAKTFAASEIDAFRNSMEANVEAVNERIDTLAARAESLTGDARAQIDEAIESLRDQRDAFMRRINEASADSADAWADLKSGLQDAWKELEQASKDAVDQFGDDG